MMPLVINSLRVDTHTQTHTYFRTETKSGTHPPVGSARLLKPWYNNTLGT